MLEIQNLTKYYRGYAVTHPALKKVSLTIQPGQIVGLFGENGAGKTTLMKCILKLLSYEGTITLDGKPISPKNITRISFATSEHSFFPTLNAWSHREFYAEHFPKFNCKIFDTFMDFFGLSMSRTVGSFFTPNSSNAFFAALCSRISCSCSARNFFEYPFFRYSTYTSRVLR